MARAIDGMAVVITGASAGIGLALARELAGRGARLTLAARRLERLESFNAEHGGAHACVRADVARDRDCERLVAIALERFGRIDALVCNAGFGLLKPVADTSLEEWRSLLAVNLLGTVACVRAALPAMRTQAPRDGWRGQVVIVSSCLARRATPMLGAYSATKAAQTSLAEALRVEERANRIAVTSVHPVSTATEFEAVASAGGGDRRLPRGPRQSAEAVARAMVGALRRPRPECWPFRPSRLIFGLATLAPRLVDRAMRVD